MKLPIKRCPKARRRTGRKAKLRVPHAPHRWIAGVYFPVGEVDGYWATGISPAEFRSIFRMPPSHPLTATRAAFLVAPVADTPIYDELVAERGRPRLDDPDA
jgi:hypothetical protein